MLNGYDISHHQRNSTVAELHEDADFFICKATEGATYKDPKFLTHINEALSYGKLIGAYHFARPEKRPTTEGAKVEAANFVRAVSPFIGKCLLALDWEMTAWNYDLSWARAWLDEVYRLTGVRPVMYCHINKTNRCEEIVGGNYGLWVVYWGKNSGAEIELPKEKIATWRTWTLWQWTSKPLDRDKFNGTVEQWKKYCASDLKEKDEDAEEHFCGCEFCKDFEKFAEEHGYNKTE